jgi:GTP-binding protein HflX
LAEPIREELQVQHRTAVLVSVPDPSRNLGKERALDELKGLVKTAGVKVVGELVQLRGRPHPGTCLGKGKIDELKDLVDATGAELIIFDNNLTPGQGRHLEQATQRVIVDRSELILDIFATHARTAEARLQVELAQLQYTRTRLKRMWTHLERIEGGIGASRGPGEKQIETDRRIIDQRIDELKIRLAEVEVRRERMVRQRDVHSLVSLVGYTIAGKSTLMNALTGADVYVADQLFATLDTRTR